ncbi:MAG: peptide chain release factor N(5)-glutamine methyltransferase [Lachnospiraceae bacterium]|nr:peptide chain release factor N(5)-glutamine methyltransferase [Lachnospiraceae bacterium]
MKYREIYELGVTRLKEAGIKEAELDARLLLEYVCHTDRNTLLAHPEHPVTEEEIDSYVNYLAEREKRVPLQHIVGYQEFMGLELYVNQHVLIPRQDTENLVEEVMPHVHDGMKILDLCTGSGCILISLLQYSNDCIGVGTDISKEALEVAAKNGEAILKEKEGKVYEQLRFVESDLFSNLPHEKFDLIVSNPPYIKTSVIDTLEPEVASFEPHLALDGGRDGLDFYRRIAKEAGSFLIRGGMLFLEIGYDQGEAVAGLLKEAGFVDIEIRKDYGGLDRVVFGTFLEECHV